MGVGIASFQKRMQAIPKAVREGVRLPLLEAADLVADEMRALVPVQEGDLRASIAVTGPGESTPPYSQPGGASFVAENTAAITAGNSKVRYAHLVEYGTTRTRAQPFFWPGLRMTKAKAAAIIKRGIVKAIREAK
jgi:HK97 gp10 family phage protein